MKRNQTLNFTKRAIEQLKPPESKREYVHDAKQSGLVLCITASGTKTFYRYGRIDGKPERIKLGRFPDVSVEQARRAAAAIAGDIARGIDPKRKKRSGTTVEDLFEHWLSHAKLHKKTWPEDQNKFDFHFKKLRHKRLADITTADIAKWHRKIGDERGPYIANRCRALLSAMYGVAHELNFKGINPCQHVKRFREESRERFLQQHEIRPFFSALQEEPSMWRDFWLLCLFTGARRGNIASMEWSVVDLDQGVWYLTGRQTKNKKSIVIVLPPPAVAILESRAEKRNGADFVFAAENSSGHVVDPRKSWSRVTKRAGIENLRPHDLRRSLGSWQAIAGTSLQIIGASLGHQDTKSTAVYARLQMDPVRTSVNNAVQAMIQAANGNQEDQE